MKRKHLLVLFSMVLIPLVTGCFQFRPTIPSYTYNLDKEFQAGKYMQKIDNFIIILDSSSSMSVIYEDKAESGYSKFRVAKDIIRLMNNTIPEMKINGAIQIYGYGIMEPVKQTETIYGLTTYSRSGLEKSLNSIKSHAEGNSPAGLAIEAVSNIIAGTKGENAVILISDGENLENGPMMKVKALNNIYGGRTCLYTIWVGNKPEGKEFMEELAKEMECGFSTSVDKIASSEDMAYFVRKVFLTKHRDSDKDGVLDHLDKCPDTPIGVEVDESGCPKVSQIDSDGDGVYDDRDECPDTPRGAIVDYRGCWVVKGVQFDYKKWDIKPQFDTDLDNVVDILRKNPELKIRIEGHTDNIASMAYNLELSWKRAQAIKNYLIENGVDQSRITTIGLGYSQPIASNDTPEGRALNRRVELIPIK
jgi:OmpA-OmpF porin, OOP family